MNLPQAEARMAELEQTIRFWYDTLPMGGLISATAVRVQLQALLPAEFVQKKPVTYLGHSGSVPIFSDNAAATGGTTEPEHNGPAQREWLLWRDEGPIKAG